MEDKKGVGRGSCDMVVLEVWFESEWEDRGIQKVRQKILLDEMSKKL